MSGEGTQYNYDTHQFLTKIYQNFKASFNITFCLENFHFNKNINTSFKVLIYFNKQYIGKGVKEF